MLFTIKRPKSRRFFQLSFDAFGPEGRNKIEQQFHTWADFFEALSLYFWRKLKLLITLIFKLISAIFSIPSAFKDFVVRKLIWSRGRLGRSVAMATVLSSAFLVFLFGEVFNSSPLVLAQADDSDYIGVVNDIIPRREIAITEVPAIRKSTEIFAYTIRSGDTLFGIGSKFKISIDALKYVNNLTDDSVLQVGEEISIPPISGLVHEVQKGDTLTSIAEKYDVPAQAVADFNYILDTSKLAVGTELVVPGAKVPTPVAPIVPSYPTPVPGVPTPIPSKQFCIWPTTVRIITQYFSWYHNGIDIATGTGSQMPPLFACTSGKVVRSGWDPVGLGLHVRIDHGNGYETVYGHMSSISVSYGENVSRGQSIGLMGNTGRSTGPHVHYMVKYHGVAQNPLNYAQ